MEEGILRSLEQIVTTTTTSPNTSILSSSISLISNPSTSDSTLASLQETLARFLQIHGESRPNSVPHVLKLLSLLSILHPRLAPSLFELVRRHALDLGSGRVGAHFLSALVTIADQDRRLTLEVGAIGEGLFLSLCFRPTVCSRMWLLVNAERFCVKPSLLVSVFLGFTKDAYPYVRRCAVDGLVRLCKTVVIDDGSLLGGCYLSGLQLLMDDEGCIRKAAVCAVSEFGMKIASMHEGQNRRDWSDLVFLEVCSLVRDMDVEVRIEVFDSLGRIEMVSENILLQALSKKGLGIIDIKRHVRHYFPSRDLEKKIPSIVGGFLHGLEDEFNEVRGSACRSLRALVVLSDRFSGEALSLLVDVLNDYSVIVRLEALSAIHAMAQHNHLKLKEGHMDMFVSSLLDKESIIRSEMRKILQSMETTGFEIFKSCVDGLIECLEMYSKEEGNILYTLFKMGQRHCNFSLRIIKEFFPEGRSISEAGSTESESGRIPAILILAISGTLSQEDRTSALPSTIFLYALAFVGRFSRALADVITTDALFSFLWRNGRISTSTLSSDNDSAERSDVVVSQLCDEMVNVEQGPDKETLYFIDSVFAKVKDMWKVVQSGHAVEVSATLRSLRKDMKAMSKDESAGCRGELLFASCYLKAVELLSRSWRVFSSFPAPRPPDDLSLVWAKLEETLRRLRQGFSGLSGRQELCIMELTCVSHLLNPPSMGGITILPLLISSVEALCAEKTLVPSVFLSGLQKSEGSYEGVLESFTPEPAAVSGGRLDPVWAEVEVPGWDPLRPLPFVPGLPVGVRMEVRLCNVKSESRVWVTMAVDVALPQSVFLDRDPAQERLDFFAPFYRTPKTASFGMKIFVGVECGPDYPCFGRRFGGPRSRLARLCPNKEIFFSIN